MQIDFHHGVTYVLARFAGFVPAEAAIVAYASQYVDDAVTTGAVRFDNGAMYARISSAHKMLDYRNFEELASHLVWVPFHFLPGNGGLPAGADPEGPFIRKLVCVPNSPVARQMIAQVIYARHTRFALHRLGIAMHVYADTWAHQGFAGVSHPVNHARELTGPGGAPDEGLMDRLKNFFINEALPLGHGTVLGNPDKPFLEWAYTNGLGERITRNNPRDFLDASDHMCRAMQCFRAGDPAFPAPGIAPRDREVLDGLLRGIREDDSVKRHQVWLEEIARGAFGFGPERVTYVEEGEGSWRHDALGHPLGSGANGGDGASAKKDENDATTFAYRPEFLRSNWKLFHDALQAHRLDVVHNLLPEYGICAA